VLAEILTIGDELCRGEIIDTNSSWLAAELWELAVTVGWMTSCRDVRDDMRKALLDATGRADLVLVSGGLGPTEDDLTVDVVAELLGVTPVVDEPARERMEKRLAAARFTIVPNTIRQVRVPGGARVLVNTAGSAPGFEIYLNGAPVICMPGVPAEMHAIFRGPARDRIIELREARGERIERVARRMYRVFGLGESHVAALLEGVLADVQGASLHYQVTFPEVLVKVVIRDRDTAAAQDRLGVVDARVRERLRHHLYGTDSDSLAATLGRALSERGATMATAESCTGGMIGSLMTDVPGSSAYFAGGAITYSNEEKMRQLGVSEQVLSEQGAVSEACVQAMARGARKAFGVDYAVAVSGVAGPGGGSPDKPVGTVWLAVAGPAGVRTKLLHWPGERGRIRILSAYWALALTLRAIIGDVKEDAPHGE
jgi:nicotinamide-nucleotide amidase